MIINHDKKFIFICTPKTASTSMQSALSGLQDEERFEIDISGLNVGKHTKPSIIKEIVGYNIWSDYFTFCFVRNPWDWVASQFFYNNRYIEMEKGDLTRIKDISKKVYYNTSSYIKNKKGYISTKDVRDVKEHLRSYRGYLDIETDMQYYYVFSRNGEKLIDFVGRFENLTNDFNKVCKRLDIECSLPFKNKSNNNDYEKLYTINSKKEVKKIWGKDISKFGYKI